ncbi:alcohol dehydrogenase-like regulatory protein ErcA [Agarivorans sp. QJM3NY_33]|uniref:alcohol dehydrogenase-like regulatory protein ErcA n=1 Tax=Agarivorans sp. QJM3NY_33 TaxID=3421432 RepID=UPI003D7E123B
MPNLLNLRKFVAPEIIFGAGARMLVGKYAQQFSVEKALLVTDPGVIAAGWLEDVQQSLQQNGIAYHVFADVSANPRSTEVMLGAEVYHQHSCNIIIAIGGGSPMDCAKGIGIVVTNNLDILKFEGVDKIQLPVPPLIFIPTTAGSSADVSQFCIIANQQERVKIAIISKSIVPDVSLIDTETTLTMDPYLTACTGIDALVHAIEAFVSTGSGVLTDMYALEAIKLIRQHLPGLIKDPTNVALKENIMLASMKSGLAFSNAILGAVHAMAHSLGGYLDLAHGECNAMLLEHVINYNFDSAVDRYKPVAEAMGIEMKGLTSNAIKHQLIASIETLKKEVGIMNQLRQKGVHASDIPILSKKAVQDACLITNPRKATAEDIKIIFEEAM